MPMYIYLPLTDLRYPGCVFIILQLPDDGWNRQPKHVGALKLAMCSCWIYN